MLDAARDLYGLPPSEFTAARNALAKLLKNTGEADDALAAKAIGGLRRPKVSEFALNRLARHEPADIRRFIDAVAAAQSAQSAAIGGDAGALRQATSELRQATATLVDTAVRGLVADGANGEAQRDDIVALLREFVSGASVGPLVAGVIGSEAIVGPDEFFPGAPDPPQDNSARRPKPAPQPPARASSAVEPRPTQQPTVRQPTASAQATAAAKKAMARAERARLTAALQASELALAKATEAVEAAQSELAMRRFAVKAARAAANAAAAELAEHDQT